MIGGRCVIFKVLAPRVWVELDAGVCVTGPLAAVEGTAGGATTAGD